MHPVLPPSAEALLCTTSPVTQRSPVAVNMTLLPCSLGTAECPVCTRAQVHEFDCAARLHRQLGGAEQSEPVRVRAVHRRQYALLDVACRFAVCVWLFARGPSCQTLSCCTHAQARRCSRLTVLAESICGLVALSSLYMFRCVPCTLLRCHRLRRLCSAQRCLCFGGLWLVCTWGVRLVPQGVAESRCTRMLTGARV